MLAIIHRLRSGVSNVTLHGHGAHSTLIVVEDGHANKDVRDHENESFEPIGTSMGTANLISKTLVGCEDEGRRTRH
jgi:hypothetical protein